MLWRVEVGLKKNVQDVHGNKVSRKIREELGIEAGEVRTIKVYTVEGLEKADIEKVLELGVLHDPVLHTPSLTPLAADFAWNLEVGFRPGVTDNEGRTAKESLVLVLKPEDSSKVKVYTSTQYIFKEKLPKEQIASIAKDLLANELIQRYEIRSAEEWEKSPGFEAKAAQVTGKASEEVAVIDLLAMNDEEMMAFSRANTLAMSIEEFHCIRDYYSDPEVIAEREKIGIGANPTDAELEALAQTWSEHCKHKFSVLKLNMKTKRPEFLLP